MRIRFFSKAKKLNNKGSALVTVIIVVMFISIVATTLLYICASNYYMKVADAKTKQSFYDTETSLEAIRAAIEEDVSKASEDAYLKVLLNYANYDAATRYAVYEDEFYSGLSTLWDARGSDKAAMLSALPGVTAEVTADDEQTKVSLGTGCCYIKDITVEYTNTDNFTAIISTDFLITPPEINLSIDKSKSVVEAGDDVNSDRDRLDVKRNVNYINWTKK